MTSFNVILNSNVYLGQVKRAIDKLSDRLGVRIESHDVLLRGACEQCG